MADGPLSVKAVQEYHADLARVGRAVEPLHRLGVVDGRTISIVVHQADAQHSPPAAQFGQFSVPAHGFGKFVLFLRNLAKIDSYAILVAIIQFETLM